MTRDLIDNVVVIMTDQQRADLSAREGFAVDCTPTLDRLARAGQWFDRAYSSAPLCVPARISMLTGRFPSAHGIRENHSYGAPRRTEDLFSLARQAGFRTAMIGKNHSHLTAADVDTYLGYGHFGRQPPLTDDSLAAGHDRWLRELGARVATEPSPYPVEAQIPSRLVDQAIDWLGPEPADTLLWLSIPEPHVPYQLPEPYHSRYTPETVPAPATDATALAGRDLSWQWIRQLGEKVGDADPDTLARGRASYVGMLRLIDDQVARLVTHLEQTGALDRTLIICLADHGDFAGEYGLLRKGPGLPEVLIRIPMSFTGPGIAAAANPSTAHVSIVDVLPTVCELLELPTPVGVQGRSLVEVLSGHEVPSEFDSSYAEQGVGGLPVTDRAVLGRLDGSTAAADGTVATLCDVTQDGAIRMIRAGRWKLIVPVVGRPQLFDLDEDPYELTDRYATADHAEIGRQLLEQLVRWQIRVADPLPVPDDGYPRQTHPRNYYW